MELAVNPAYAFRYSALPEPVLRDNRLHARDLRLLSALYMIAGRGNIVRNKSRSELGRLAGEMAENVVSVISARLVKLGWLKKTGNGGRSKAAEYQLTVPEEFQSMRRVPKDSASASVDKKISPKETRQWNGRVKEANPSQGMTGLKTKPDLNSSKPTTTGAQCNHDQDSSCGGGIDKSNHQDQIMPLVLPTGIDDIQARAAVMQLPTDRQQEALDEFSGQLASYRQRQVPVTSPVGLLRTIVKSIQAGNLPQHAYQVRQARERAAGQAQVNTKKPQPNPLDSKPSNADTKPSRKFKAGELASMLNAKIAEVKAKRMAEPTKETVSEFKLRTFIKVNTFRTFTKASDPAEKVILLQGRDGEGLLEGRGLKDLISGPEKRRWLVNEVFVEQVERGEWVISQEDHHQREKDRLEADAIAKGGPMALGGLLGGLFGMVAGKNNPA